MAENEMVERVAAAISESSGQSWASATDGYREICIGFARAAIEAMRESAGSFADFADTRYPDGIASWAVEDAARDTFQGWIDAALSPETGVKACFNIAAAD